MTTRQAAKMLERGSRMELQTATHTASVENGVLKVHTLVKRDRMSITRVDENGVCTYATEPLPATLQAYFNFAPILAAVYAGDDNADVDLDCGAQRWRGYKPLTWIRDGLKKAGFDRKQINAILAEMNAVEDASCPHYY